MELNQKTLDKPVIIVGKGLHSGRIVRMEILPAKAHNGITFERTDTGAAAVKASIENVSSTELSTTIGVGLQTVNTIEHVMAAFHGLGIDNAHIRLNGPEVPIMDGSAEPFMKRFVEAGITSLRSFRKFWVVQKPFEVKVGESYIRVAPSKRLTIRCSINFSKDVIGYQTLDFEHTAQNFAYVATARTFCHIDDVQDMRRRGLALGGSLQNAVVVTVRGIMNEGGLRGDNEFVRHKLLDLVGDIFLLDGFLLGSIVVHKPGHSLHAEFLRRLVDEPGVVRCISGARFAEAEDEATSQPFDLPAYVSFA